MSSLLSGRSRRGSWIASVRKSYMDWLIDRIDPDAPGTFGFADGQAKAVFDFTPRHQVQALVIAGRSISFPDPSGRRGCRRNGA